jgi:hypothetical protein
MRIHECRSCQSTALRLVLDLGNHPPSNPLVTAKSEASDEARYALHFAGEVLRRHYRDGGGRFIIPNSNLRVIGPDQEVGKTGFSIGIGTEARHRHAGVAAEHALPGPVWKTRPRRDDGKNQPVAGT